MFTRDLVSLPRMVQRYSPEFGREHLPFVHTEMLGRRQQSWPAGGRNRYASDFSHSDRKYPLRGGLKVRPILSTKWVPLPTFGGARAMFVHSDQWLATPPPRICRHSVVGMGFRQDADQPDTPPAARAMVEFATGERVSEN